MRARVISVVAVLALFLFAANAGAATTSSTALTQVKAVYRTVLTAEYFGPSSGVCSHLTASGLKSYTAGGGGSCAHVFAQVQHVLQHKTKGVDDSGYTPKDWREVVNQVMAGLKVSIHGTHATAIGPSGIPGQTTLVEVGGKWFISSYPPSIEP